MIAAAATCLLAASASAQEPAYVLAGDAGNAFIVRTDTKESLHDVVHKKAGEQWAYVAHKRKGAPTVGAAADGVLHLFARRGDAQAGDYIIYNPSVGQMALGPAVPGVPLAACIGGDLRVAGGKARVIVISWEVFQAPVSATAASAGPTAASAEPTATAAATAPLTTTQAATAPGTRIIRGPNAHLNNMRPAQLVRLSAYALVANQWKLVAVLPQPIAIGPDTRAFAAVHGGVLYVMVGQSGGNSLKVFSDGRWLDDAQLDDSVRQATLSGMASLDGRLVAVMTQPQPATATTQPGQRKVLVASTTRPAEELRDAQPVTRNDQELFVAAANQPHVAIFGDQLSLLWTQDDKLAMATSRWSGQVVSYEFLTAFDKPPIKGYGRQVFDILIWSVLIMTFLALFMIKPSSPPKPFALPEVVVTAPLAKRLLAGIVDLLPFLMLAVTIFPPEQMAMDGLVAYVKLNQSAPDNILYALTLALGLYLPYCIFMELRYQATVGKMLMGLRVVGDEARRVGLREVALRNLLKVMELAWLPVLLLWPLVNRNRQRLGDMLARTSVVDARTIPPTPPPQPPTTPGPE